MENATLPLKIRGIFRSLVLYSLKDTPLHGYGIANKISKLLEGVYRPSSGTLYPTLWLLEKEGLVASRTEGRRRIYTLTPKGMKELHEKMNEVEIFIKRVRKTRKLMKELGIFSLLKTIWYASPILEDKTEFNLRVKYEVKSLIDKATNLIKYIASLGDGE